MNKRIKTMLSLMLALMLVMGGVVSAAGMSYYNVTEKKAYPVDMTPELIDQIIAEDDRGDQIARFVGDKLVDLGQLRDEVGKALKEALEAGKTLDEAKVEVAKAIPTIIEELEEVEIPSEDELKVVEVSAINSTQAEVKFSKEVKEVKPANFKVTDKDGNLVFVSKVELNEAKDVATLTFFDKFADKGIYTVEVSNVKDVDGNVMEKDTAKFEYVKADVAKVEFAATTIAPEKNVKDLVKVTDKLGRDVTDEVEIEFESSNLSVIDTNGDVKGADNESAIVVAKVKVGDGYVKSAPTTIKVSKKAPDTFVGYYVYEDAAAANTDEFAKLDEDKKINYVYEDDYDTSNNPTKKLALYYKDQYGKSIDVVPNKNVDVAITNLTPNIVIVEKGNDVLDIKPIYPGEGYVKIKVGEVEHTIKIVVREKAKVATMKLDKTDVSVVAKKAGEIVKVEFKDQFGDEIAPAKELKVESKDDKIAKATVANDKKSITIKGLKEGATTVEVTYKDEDNKIDLKETINVTVAKAGELAKYEVVADTTKLDVNGYESKPAKDNKLPKSTTITVYEIDENGNKLGTVDATNITLTEVDKDGKKVEKDNKVKINDKTLEVTAEKAGKAYIKVSVGSLVIDTVEIEIVNTESVATSVEFDRRDLVINKGFTVAEDGTVKVVKDNTNDNKNEGIDIKEQLKSIIKVLDQDGNVMKDTNNKNIEVDAKNITIETTNAKGLEVSENKITKITSANPTVDVVVTEVKEGEENLLKAPTTIKVAVKVEEQEGNVTATAWTVAGDNQDVNPLGSVIVQLNWDDKANITNGDVESLKIELYNGKKLLATNILQPEKLNDNERKMKKIDSPFNLGRSEKHDKWAWVRGEYPLQGDEVTAADLPNKVVATYVVNGIKYVSEIELDNLTVPSAYEATEVED